MSDSLETPREPLAGRMKQYEAVYDSKLPPDTPAILRLDGHNFSKFTSHFNRPFDERIHTAMVQTCSSLLSHFPSATLAYTQSDEITLVFPTGLNCFNDRIQKVATLAASYCTVQFNLHLSSALASTPEPPVKNADNILGAAHFDARLFTVPTVEEALNCLLWRCRGDAVRNSVSAFAQTLFSTKELHGKSTEEVKEMMIRDKGIVFEDAVPSWAVEGTIVKRERFVHEGVNGKSGEVERSVRTRMRAEDRGVRVFDEEGLRLAGEKYWNEDV